MKQAIYLLLAFLLLPVASWAQTVTGLVEDEDGPLMGATVQVKGTSNTTATNLDGEFELKGVNVKDAVLEVRYVGYETKTIKLEGKTHVDVYMEANTKMMDEVVVIGYGTVKRGNITGAMSALDGKTIEAMPVANVGEAIVGHMPGVQVTTPDGSPDAEVSVRVRGGGSITQSNEPLVLIDGFEGSLNDVPPTDIEDIQVLKDAAATAIYGARGANGVVLVTTRKPQGGKVSVNVNAYVKTSELSKKLDVLSPYDFIRAQWDRLRPKGASTGTAFSNQFGMPYEFYIYQGYAGTDWQDEIFSTHPVSWAVDGNISGGNDIVKFKINFMHQDQPSVMPDNGLRQDNLNLNMNVKLFKFLTFDYRNRFYNKTLDGRGTEGISLLTAMQEQPTNGLQDFTTTPSTGGISVDESGFIEYYHYDPLETNARFYRKRKSSLNNMSGALNWTIIPGMILRNEFTWEQFTQNDRKFNAANSNSASKTYGPNLTEENKDRQKWQLTNTLNYNFTFKDRNDLALMIGQEMKSESSETSKVYIGWFPTNIDAEKAFDNYGLGTPISNSSTKPSPIRVSSFFGRANYSYDDRYLATFTMRADGSSKFARGNRWGYFPAGALAWRINNEAFLRQYTWLTNLKLRASMGASGNDRIDSDLYIKLYSLGDISKASGMGGSSSYWYQFQNSYPVNPDIKWETTITRNIGLDFAFFNGRIDGSFEVYFNTTKNLLLETVIPGDTGFTSMISNVGQTSNKGVEFNINATIYDSKDWTVGANFNIGYNHGKIDKLAADQESFYAAVDNVDRNEDVFWYTVGQRMGNILGYVSDGFYKVEDFNYDASSNTYTLKPGVVNCAALIGTDPAPGDPKYKKFTDDGTDDLTEADRQVIGNTTPKFSGGFGVNARWRDIDFSAFFNFMCGFDVINLNKVYMSMSPSSSSQYRNLDGEFANMWHYYDEMGNDLRSNPELYAYYNRNATIWNPAHITKAYISDYCVEDGSFLRLQNLTVGYTVPRKWSQKAGMSRCRVYFTGCNLFTITKYSGYDPEVEIGQGLTPNIDYNKYPRCRTYTFGVQVGF